jgi:hypothetical protein
LTEVFNDNLPKSAHVAHIHTENDPDAFIARWMTFIARWTTFDDRRTPPPAPG